MKKNRKKKEVEPLTVKLGVAWYKPEQWKRLREVCEDRDNIEDTFDEWQVNAEKGIRIMRSQGAIPQKVLFDVEEFLAWCSVKGLPHNGESRSEFTAWLMRKHDRAGKGLADSPLRESPRSTSSSF